MLTHRLYTGWGIIKVANMVIEWLWCEIVILIVALVAWQVFTRYILGNPSVTSESVARYMFVRLIFLALAYVFGRRGHKAINFVIDKLKPENRLKLDTLNQVIQIVFSGGNLATIYKEMGLNDFKHTLLNSAEMTGILLFLIGVSSIMS